MIVADFLFPGFFLRTLSADHVQIFQSRAREEQLSSQAQRTLNFTTRILGKRGKKGHIRLHNWLRRLSR